MHRRQLFLGSAAIALTACNTSFAQVACVPPVNTTFIDAVAQIRSLRIPSGPYAGGYEIAPNGRLNWYFTNLGLLPIVQSLGISDLDTYIRTYLDLYLQKLEADATIQDVNFPQGRANTEMFVKVLSDSDDSYAATFLSLVARYLRASQNWSWWNTNKSKLKTMAYRNLAVMAKANGLTSVFQPPRNAGNAIGYLMDNCEVYRGLRDFASLLRDRGDTADANYYDAFASGISRGIGAGLFDTARAGFTAGDFTSQAATTFYPGTTCQVFPQAFGVVELAQYFDRAWNYLQANSPGWADGRYDPYTWNVLGFTAAKRGDFATAQAQMRTTEQKFIAQRPLVTINELGFYQRTRNLVSGQADI
jgi:hypothetical protein